MEEKRRYNELEQENNKRFVKMVIDRDEKDNQDIKEKNQQALQRRIEIQKYQRLQMGEFTSDEQSIGGATSIPMSIGGKRRPGNSKAKLGGPMHLEEIRMNKNLLKEISKIKKQGRTTDRPGLNDSSIQMEKGRDSGLGRGSSLQQSPSKLSLQNKKN